MFPYYYSAYDNNETKYTYIHIKLREQSTHLIKIYHYHRNSKHAYASYFIYADGLSS